MTILKPFNVLIECSEDLWSILELFIFTSIRQVNIKFFSASSKMDPTNVLPAEMVEQVFVHLYGKDLAQSTLVSRKWNQHIGASPLVMKNIRLFIRGDWMNIENEIEQVMKSNRKYQKILISCGTEIYDEIHQIMLRSQNRWSSVEIFDLDFETFEQFIAFMIIIADSVEHLLLDSVVIKENFKGQNLNFQFKKLKSLNITRCEKTMYDIIFPRCQSSLKALTLGNVKPVVENSSFDIIKFLRTLQLKEFHLDDGKLFKEIFSNDSASKLSMRLEKLHIANSYTSLAEETIENFGKFLIQQISSIKILYLGDMVNDNILKIVFQMKNLKDISLENLPQLDDPLKINNSIEKMDVSRTSKFEELKKILKATPNLKQIKMRAINRSKAKFIAEHLKKISKIKLFHPYEYDLSDILPNIDID